MIKKSSDTQPGFGIATVSQLTGISQHLLRIWEKRYEVVKVARSESGRRLYSEADVQRLLLIKHLVDCGESVSKVASMSDSQLEKTTASLRDQNRARSQLNSDKKLTVAVLGDFLPSQLESTRSHPESLSFIACSTSIPNFRADIRRLQPDALVIEVSIFNKESAAFIEDLMSESGARLAVVAYGFSRREELAALRSRGIRTVRTPCDLEQIYETLRQDPLPSSESIKTKRSQGAAVQENLTDIPRRLFSVQELAKLANASSTVDCECPTHLVDLVVSLTAFEAYSAACENKNDKDAALHAYLHATTASVRATLEVALERVARAEGLID